MNTVRRTLIKLALVLAVAPVAGWTFGVLPRDGHDPALSAMPPCYTGDVVCGVPWDGAGFAWMHDAIQAAGRSETMGIRAHGALRIPRDVLPLASVRILHGLAIVADAHDRGACERHG